ncbi:unnamed protein product, partial [Heterotrigona itama]
FRKWNTSKHIQSIRCKCKNLTFKTESYVTKLLADRVILSAGFINSSKILMFSAIGTRKELKNCGIEIISNL